MSYDKTPPYLKLDERNHVEKPFFDQLDGLVKTLVLTHFFPGG
jgi:type I restriction enzyme R subunit